MLSSLIFGSDRGSSNSSPNTGVEPTAQKNAPRLMPRPLGGQDCAAMNNEEWKREQLNRTDEARLVGRAERAARTQVHGIIPDHFFSAASSECRDAFIDGHYYASISLAQAVAEGLCRYLGDFHKVGARKDPPQRVRRLRSQGFISQQVLDAFLRIWGNDRNTFHHVNADIQTDYLEIERRAEECVRALMEIESDVFAYEISEDGKIVPTTPGYWPREDAEHVQVFLRLSGH